MVKIYERKYTESYSFTVGRDEVLDGTLFMNYYCSNIVKYIYIGNCILSIQSTLFQKHPFGF